MRMHTVLLCLTAAVMVAMICVATPKIEVTLNEEGTELLGVSLFKSPSAAIASTAR